VTAAGETSARAETARNFPAWTQDRIKIRIMILSLLRRNRAKSTIEALYGVIVAQARLPSFYVRYGVPDTVDGRFEMMVLHLWLLSDRIAREPGDHRALGQGLFDRFCVDLDHNLREMGVGDLTVPRRMKGYAEAYLGRSEAYRAALASEDAAQLPAALARNVFGAPGVHAQALQLAAYVHAAARQLAGARYEALAAGEAGFPDPETQPTVPAA
jgi:cytochrome b pre-mRNA-processing protein 3